MLRSLHIDAGRSWRGGQRQVYLLAKALRARGREPLVVGVAGSPLLERLQASGIATASTPMRSDWDLRSAKRLRSIIRAWRPHVVHAHDARSHAIALIALAGETTPLIVTRRVTFPLRSVRVKYGLRVTRFIAISRAVREAMVRSGIDEQRIDVVHSGVPFPIAKSARDWRGELGWPPNVVVAGIVGAMTPEKGTESLRHIATWMSETAVRQTRIVAIGGPGGGALNFGPLAGFQTGFVAEVHNAMAGLDLLSHGDLLLAAGVLRSTGAAVGRPGARRELQPAGETVAGVDGPVATAFTLRQGVPGAAGGCIRARSGNGQTSSRHGSNGESAANVARQFCVLHGCVLRTATFAPPVPGHLHATVPPVNMEVISVARRMTVCGVGRPGHSWATIDAAGPEGHPQR